MQWEELLLLRVPNIPVKDSLYGKTLFASNSNGRGSLITSKLTKSYASGWYASLQGTFKRFGDSEAPDYVLSNTGVNQQNISVKVGFKSI